MASAKIQDSAFRGVKNVLSFKGSFPNLARIELNPETGKMVAATETRPASGKDFFHGALLGFGTRHHYFHSGFGS